MFDPFEDVFQAVRELKGLLPRVGELVPAKGSTPQEQSGSGSSFSYRSMIPWSSPAAEFVLEVHESARRWESLLSLRLHGLARYRAPGDDGTVAALEQISLLLPMTAERAHAGKVHDLDVGLIRSGVSSYPRRARALLGEPLPGEEAWPKAPADLVCPFCEERLEMAPAQVGRVVDVLTADLVCRRCRDEQGDYRRFSADTWIGLASAPDETLTEREAIDQYGLGSSTIRQWMRRGKVHSVGRRAGKRLYRRDRIEELMSEPADTQAVEAVLDITDSQV